jgi:hypothetical protein
MDNTQSTTFDTTRAIDVIDSVVNKISLPLSDMSDSKVSLLFARIFSQKDDNTISHYLDKFILNNDKDFGRYFLSCDDGMIRALFGFFDIPVEPEKISDAREKIIAQIKGRDKFEIFPFEYEITRLFYLFGNNNSLEALQEIAPEAFQRVKEKKINLYGNGINWSKAWNVLNQPEKTRLIETVVNY